MVGAHRDPTTATPRQYDENGVDLSLWHEVAREKAAVSAPVRFLFAGRLVDWKGVDLLLEAFQQVKSRTQATLDVLGLIVSQPKA